MPVSEKAKNRFEWLYRWAALTMLGLILRYEISTHERVMNLDTFRQLQEQTNAGQNRRLDHLEFAEKKNNGDHRRYEIMFARMAVGKNDEWPELLDQKE